MNGGGVYKSSSNDIASANSLSEELGHQLEDREKQ